MRYFLACIIVILLVLNASPVLAREVGKVAKPTAGQINEALNNLTPVRFLPNNPLYFFIRGKEIISRFFQPSFRERAQFDYTISSKRLKETYLLTSRGDLAKTGDELSSYAKTLRKIEVQLEKARSQNQDITVIVDQISDNLRFQEVIFLALSNFKSQYKAKFGDQLEVGLSSFGDFISYLDKIKPGVRNRFQLFIWQESGFKTLNVDIPISSPSPSIVSESSGQAKPRKIIY